MLKFTKARQVYRYLWVDIVRYMNKYIEIDRQINQASIYKNRNLQFKI